MGPYWWMCGNFSFERWIDSIFCDRPLVCVLRVFVVLRRNMFRLVFINIIWLGSFVRHRWQINSQIKYFSVHHWFISLAVQMCPLLLTNSFIVKFMTTTTTTKRWTNKNETDICENWLNFSLFFHSFSYAFDINGRRPKRKNYWGTPHRSFSFKQRNSTKFVSELKTCSFARKNRLAKRVGSSA